MKGYLRWFTYLSGVESSSTMVTLTVRDASRLRYARGLDSQRVGVSYIEMSHTTFLLYVDSLLSFPTEVNFAALGLSTDRSAFTGAPWAASRGW